MMKTILRLSISLCIVMSILSCDKIDDNGDLGGMWQLTEWKSLPDGAIKANKDQFIFWSVQLDLMKFSIYNDISTYHLSRFSHRGDSLFVGTVYQRPDEKIVPVTELAKYGVPAKGAFAVEHLSSSSMVLRSDEAILRFRKY